MSSRLPKPPEELREIEKAMRIYDETKANVREIRRMRKLGASDYEIANALGVPEELVTMCP